MKKRLCALLAMLLAMALVACENSATSIVVKPQEEPTAIIENPTGSSQPSSLDTTKKQLSVWCWDQTSNIYAMKEAERLYQEQYPGFVLNLVETPWDDIQIQLITAASSGDLSDLPDIFLCQNNAFQKDVLNFPELFTDLTNLGIAFEEYDQGALSYVTVEGKNWGVPFTNGTAVFALRTDILAQAGYKLADFTDITWQDCLEKGKIVLEQTGKPLFAFQEGTAEMVLMMLRSAGQSLFTQQGTAQLTENQPLQLAVQTYIDLVNAGVVLEVKGEAAYGQAAASGAVAGVLNVCTTLSMVQDAQEQSGKWGITNIPKLAGVVGATNYTASGGTSWAIAASSKEQALALDFLRASFAGTIPFYQRLSANGGIVPNWLPAVQSDIYKEPHSFFGGQAVQATIINYSSKVPTNTENAYYYEAEDALGNAITHVISGNQDIAYALEAAQAELQYSMR